MCSRIVYALQESHSGGLMGHFVREKTLFMQADHFYWPKMRRLGRAIWATGQSGQPVRPGPEQVIPANRLDRA